MYSATGAAAVRTAGTGASITAVIGLCQQALSRLLHNWNVAGDGTGETLWIGVYRASGSRGGEVLHPRCTFGRQQLVVEQEPSRVRGFEGIVVVWLLQRSEEQCDGHLRRSCNPPSAVEDRVFRHGKRHGLTDT